jgi:hypothetical protein
MAKTVNASMLKKWARPGMHWVWLSLAMYAIACCLPSFSILAPIRGWTCLTHGALLAFEELVNAWKFQSFQDPNILVWWLANPMYFWAAAMYWFRYRKAAAVIGSIAVIPGLHFEFSSNEDILPGCVMWVASLQVMALNAIWQVWVDRKTRQKTEVPPNVE